MGTMTNDMAALRIQPDLNDVRRRIEEVDGELVDLIALRCRLVRTAGGSKHAAGLPVEDPRQEASVVRRAASRARDAGVEEEVVRHIFWALIGLARSIQVGRGADELP